MQPKGIFISYRRQEAAGYAGRLYDRLASHFGAERVFMDVEGIEPGVDFVEELERAVASCDVLILIIGPGWLATDSAGKRRLDDPKDFVHIETAAALERHIRVVPVLVDGAVMPREEQLPTNLAKLARRQAIELNNKHWDATTAELIRTLDTRGARRFWVIGGGVAALAAAAVGIYLTLPWKEPEKPVPHAERAAVAPPADTVARTPEKTAPTPEKPPAAPEKAPPVVAEKPPAPPAEKAAPPPAEKPAAPPPAPKPAPPTEKHPPSSVEKSAPPPTQKPAAPPAQKPVPAPMEKPAPSVAKTDAPPATTTPAPPVEKPSTPVAVAPTPAPPATVPVAPAAALPATLPRVGDNWEYRMRSKWATDKARTYAHTVTAVSAREVGQAMSIDSNPGAAVRQAFTPNTRFVEWRGQGFYLLEFNPFLEAFGGLQDAATLNVPAMPAENPNQTGWFSRARIRGYESVSVPAGTFKALKVEIDSTRQPTEGLGSKEPIRTLLTLWYAPEVKRTVKMLRVVLTEQGMHLDEDTYELVRYRVQ